MIWRSSLSILSVPDGVCSRNASCALNYISTFVFLSLGLYHCWWTISPYGRYHSPNSQCFSTDMA